MKHLSAARLYPVAILLVLIAVGMGQFSGLLSSSSQVDPALKQSVYWEPWENFGVICRSELQDAQLPFNVTIHHPPGDREHVIETVRRLVRTGAPPAPWPESILYRFRILRTECMDSWPEAYRSFPYGRQDDIYVRLTDPEHPSDADYRQAILGKLYSKAGTVPVALEWYPPAP